MAPGLHCSTFPGNTDPSIPSGESWLEVNRERKTWEMKGSLWKSRQQEKKRKKNKVREKREVL